MPLNTGRPRHAPAVPPSDALRAAPALERNGLLGQAFPEILHGRCLRSAESLHLDTPALRQSLGLWGVREGAATLHRPGQEPVVLRRPAAFLTEPGCRVDTGPRAVIYLLHFTLQRPVDEDGSATHQDLATLFGSPMPLVLPEPLVESALAGLEEILVRWWRSDVDRLHARGTLAVLLASFHDAVQPDDGVAARFVRLVEERAAYGVGVQWLARRLGISVSTLGAACRRAFGCSPAQILDAHRMELAAGFLVKHPEAPIDHIASCVGYRDHSAFGRRFRQVHGCTPSAYRLKHATNGHR